MSDELERLRTVNEAQAATLRAVRARAEMWRKDYEDVWTLSRPSLPDRWYEALMMGADELLAILDGTATPKVQP